MSSTVSNHEQALNQELTDLDILNRAGFDINEEFLRKRPDYLLYTGGNPDSYGHYWWRARAIAKVLDEDKPKSDNHGNPLQKLAFWAQNNLGSISSDKLYEWALERYSLDQDELSPALTQLKYSIAFFIAIRDGIVDEILK